MVENGVVNEKGCIRLVVNMLGLSDPLEALIRQYEVAIRIGTPFSGTEGVSIPGYRERVEGLLMVVETPLLLTEFARIVDRRVFAVLQTPWLEATRLRFQLDNPRVDNDVMGLREITTELGKLPECKEIKIDRVREIVKAGVTQLSRSERAAGPIMQFLESQGNQGSRSGSL